MEPDAEAVADARARADAAAVSEPVAESAAERGPEVAAKHDSATESTLQSALETRLPPAAPVTPRAEPEGLPRSDVAVADSAATVGNGAIGIDIDGGGERRTGSGSGDSGSKTDGSSNSNSNSDGKTDGRGIDGDFWHTTVMSLIAADAVSALVRELALQSQLIVREGERWRLRVESQALGQPAVRDRLMQALAAAGHVVGLEVEVAGPIADSPARRNAQAAEQAQRDAEASILADPFVQAMMRDFGAKIVPGSVKPAVKPAVSPAVKPARAPSPRADEARVVADNSR